MNTQKIGRVTATAAVVIILCGYGQLAVADAMTSGGSREQSVTYTMSGMDVAAAELRHFVVYNNVRILFKMPSLSAESIDEIVDGEAQKMRLLFTARNLATNFSACSIRTPITGE